MNKPRILIIGDIHGCYDELLDLLDEIHFGDQDRAIAVGDLISKGPKNKEVLDLFISDRRFSSVLGNHDYYAGAAAWSVKFEALGVRLLRNTHVTIERGSARLLIGGVIDFAARLDDPQARPRPDLATNGDGAAFRLLLAHNPKIAPLAEKAGFDLQLSGHTHGGQFFPWTLAVRYVHAPHAAGLSRRRRMWVYVSAGTGTWGPPVRFGTTPELTVLRLVRAPVASQPATPASALSQSRAV